MVRCLANMAGCSALPTSRFGMNTRMLCPAGHRELIPVDQTGRYSRSVVVALRVIRADMTMTVKLYSKSIVSQHTTASRLVTESYSRCNRPGATPDLTC